jgi:hypothetical protein
MAESKESTKSESDFEEFPLPKEYGIDFRKTPAVTQLAWSVVLFYSLMCSLIVGSSWYTMIGYFILGEAAFYAWHWQAHRLETFVN